MLQYTYQKAMEIIYLCEGGEKSQIKETHFNISNNWEATHIYYNRYAIVKWIYESLTSQSMSAQPLNSDGSLWTDIVNAVAKPDNKCSSNVKNIIDALTKPNGYSLAAQAISSISESFGLPCYSANSDNYKYIISKLVLEAIKSEVDTWFFQLKRKYSLRFMTTSIISINQ